MTARKITHDGKVYATASHRRFVIFSHSTDGSPYIYKRTDNVDTAKAARNKSADAVIIDFVGGKVYSVATGLRWVDPVVTVAVDLYYFDPAVSGFPFPGASRDELLALPRSLVCSYDTPLSDGILDEAFARFNRGSGQEHPLLDRKKLRSLSVGDAVVVNNANIAAICASLGWEHVDANEV